MAYKIIEDLPNDVLGVRSFGHITHDDYAKVLIPAAEKKLADHGKIKILFIMEEYEGMDLSAMWDDTKFGLKHWSGFTHIAIVSDYQWLQSLTAVFAPLVPAEVRIYSLARLDEATEWIKTVH